MDVEIDGCAVRALVDTGCSRSIVASWISRPSGVPCAVVTVDGSRVICEGEAAVSVSIGGRSIRVNCILARTLFSGVGSILGMDFIRAVGGFAINRDGIMFPGVDVNLRFVGRMAETSAAAVDSLELSIVDPDFSARFDGKVWIVRWNWKDERLPVLLNRVACYESTKQPEVHARFEEEVESWIAKGWLQPCEDESTGGIIPLMAVSQETKNKVRPVMDFRELNKFVESHPGMDASVCDETLRKWRRFPEPLKLVDLKSAYLQLHVDNSLWRFQRVSFRGKLYYLTRLGFGLNSAPKIMSKILKKVLSLDEAVFAGTSSYIDDIIVNENIVTAERVVAHLQKYGLETKPPEDLEGGRVLGLCLHRNDRDGTLRFRRGNSLPNFPCENLTRRELFSICGRLVGHYPICGWLRVACSYVKRESEGYRWEDWVGEKTQRLVHELLDRVARDDPVGGRWSVPDKQSGIVWCDASSLALGVVLEVSGVVVEDGAWLRKPNDVSHINIAELDAVVKGLNLALKWDLRSIVVKTDSSTVLSWLRAVLTGDYRVKVAGMSDMLVKRRLSVIRELIDEYRLSVDLQLVASTVNRADALTRVNKLWLQKEKTASCCALTVEELTMLHDQHHFGIERSLYLAQLVDPSVKRRDVEACVRSCLQCRSNY